MLSTAHNLLNTSAPNLSEEALNKRIILIQSCLISGHSFQAIMHHQAGFIQQATGAGLMAMCVERKQQLGMEFLGPSKRAVLTLLKKYKIRAHSLTLEKFLHHYHSDLLTHGHVLEIHSLEKVFEGLLSKDQCEKFSKELGFKSAFIHPLFSFEEVHIGYVVYFYLRDHVPNTGSLGAITSLLQTIIRPLYEPETETFYSKCIRLSNQELEMLTPTEKRIVRQLIKAKTNADIAEEMHVSVNTIKTHTKHIFSKLNVNSKLELFNKLKNLNV